TAAAIAISPRCWASAKPMPAPAWAASANACAASPTTPDTPEDRMELTELQQAWQRLDTRLAGLEAEARTLRRERGLDRLRSRLRLFSLAQGLQLLAGVAIVLMAGPWWVRHWGEWHLVPYGVAIHAWGLALLIIALVQLMLAWLLDYSKPLATVQRQLLRLRRVRVWGERWLLVAGFAVWMPLVFAGLATFGL